MTGRERMAPHEDTKARRERLQLAGVAFLALALALFVQLPRPVPHDVAYLTWVAGQVAGPAVFGHDIREINPPLCFLIYTPAVLLGKALALDLAIKLWVCALAALSFALTALAAPAARRLPILLALGPFFALAFPWDFGQREQIALLLCAPYATGAIARRRWALLSGIAAGVGFAIKPHFLIALALVLLTRRRIRTEEWAIAATGAAYAAALLLVFPAYLTEMLPIAQATYWSVGAQDNASARIAILGTLLAGALALLAIRRDATALGLGAAALGFLLAALAQGKYFQYHFVPAWGFLVMLCAARLDDPFKPVRLAAIALLAVAAALLALWAAAWLGAPQGRYAGMPRLLREIDRADGFLVLAVHPYPAFPTAIYTRTPYVGVASSNGALPAVGMALAAGAPDRAARIGRLALDHALTELRRRPALVIVDPDWVRHTGLAANGFDALAWLRRDPEFARLWRGYRPAGRVGRFALYRRVAPKLSLEVND